MKKRFPLIFAFLVAVLVGLFAWNAQFSASLVGDPVKYAKCEEIDVSGDGRINVTDLVTVRNFLNTASAPQKICTGWDITTISACRKMDVSNDDTVDIRDDTTMRDYMTNTTSVRWCPSLLSLCKEMDISKDGRISASDIVKLRIYVADPLTLKTCNDTQNGAAIPLCQTMDITNDGIVDTKDEPALLSYISDPNTYKICNISGTYIQTSCFRFEELSVIREMRKQIENRIAGLTASNTTKNLFTTRGDATQPWVRNADVWTAKGSAVLDFTGASPWNSSLGYKRAGTLISPRHIVFANHYAIPNGATVIFVDKNNAVITRTLQNQEYLSADIRVGVLDADVPSSIAHYPVMDYNDLKKLLSLSSTGMVPAYVPMVVLDQEDKAVVRDAYFITQDLVNHMAAPVGSDRNKFNEEMITGDSGNPGFFVIDNQLVLALTHFGPSAGPNYGAFINRINQAMTNLGGGYQVKKFDVSCFRESLPK